MDNKLSIFEKLGLATIRIECTLKNGAISTGTGFFVKFHDQGKQFVPAIVTNKHVVKDAQKGTVYFTLSERDNDYPAYGYNYRYEVADFENAWRKHPDPDIDLCAMPLTTFFMDMKRKGMKPYIHFLNLSLIPTEDDIAKMTGNEEVSMIGYPNGLWDATHNQPIFRSGVLASHYKFDWNNKSEFVIDAACFPGSSGSPVMLINIGQVYSKEGLNIGSSRIKFLGVLYAGPVMSADGSIHVEPVPTSGQISTRTDIPINLGYVIKASNLLDFNQIFKAEIENQGS